MTASELLNGHKISNFRLLWLIHGHKVEASELKNFSKEQLKDILSYEDRQGHIKELKKLLG